MATKIALIGHGINTKPKPVFVGYAQIGGETLKKIIYE